MLAGAQVALWNGAGCKRLGGRLLGEAGVNRLKAGKSAPTVFYNRDTSGRCVVHGDEFTFLELEGNIRKIIAGMEGWYEVKV